MPIPDRYGKATILSIENGKDQKLSLAKNLYCECGFAAPLSLAHICPSCLGPLSVGYDFTCFRQREFLEDIKSRENSIWRYKEFLPERKTTNTILRPSPLFRSSALEKEWGVKEVWIKDDSALPTHSFKDRVVEVALQTALRLGISEIGCASTGNLAQAVASAAARAQIASKVFVPAGIEEEKIRAASVYGSKVEALETDYDGVNLHCSLLAEKESIGFVNINLRPYYAEGSKTLVFESAEALGWDLPENIVAPMASGSLLSKVFQASCELQSVGLLGSIPRIHGGQDEGWDPIARAFKEGAEWVVPEKAGRVLAHSLAIGNPGSGDAALGAIRSSHGSAADVTAEEISSAISLLARSTGVWTESAGGVTVAAAEKLVRSGDISKDSSLLLLVTGEGLKTPSAAKGETVANKRKSATGAAGK